MIDTCCLLFDLAVDCFYECKCVRLYESGPRPNRDPLSNVWLMLIDNNWLLIVVHVNCCGAACSVTQHVAHCSLSVHRIQIKWLVEHWCKCKSQMIHKTRRKKKNQHAICASCTCWSFIFSLISRQLCFWKCVWQSKQRIAF